MPEFAFETSIEENEKNSEDDIMSDEEDELRLRQVMITDLWEVTKFQMIGNQIPGYGLRLVSIRK